MINIAAAGRYLNMKDRRSGIDQGGKKKEEQGTSCVSTQVVAEMRYTKT